MEQKDYDKFSVITSVYKNDKVEFVSIALDSIINQTVRPAEILLVIDGPVGRELDLLIDKYEKTYSDLINVIRLKENGGLGNALHLATQKAKYELIARMDSDDISIQDRFEKQLQYFAIDKELSLVGGCISEFIDSTTNIVGYRRCPLSDRDIKKYMRRRCPFNHVSVMFRKSDVLRSGNYQNWFCNEDYYLWIRMAEAGCRFANLPDVLVNVRVGKEMYRRRGGWKYFKSEAKLQGYMLSHKLISLPRYVYNVTGRFAIQVAIPNRMRGFIFQKFFRK